MTEGAVLELERQLKDAHAEIETLRHLLEAYGVTPETEALFRAAERKFFSRDG